MILVDQGLLDLDLPVFECDGVLGDIAHKGRSCQPAHLNMDPRLKKITTRQLLHHTAGWELAQDVMFGGLQGIDYGSATCLDLLKAMMAFPLQFSPGTRIAYTNLGYCALALIIEKVWSDHKGSRYSYGQVVRTLLLDQAGISNVEMYLGEDKAKDYESVGQCGITCGPRGSRVQTPDGYYPGAWNQGAISRRSLGAGGWVASTEALMKLVRVVTAPHCLRGRCLLSESSRALLVSSPGLPTCPDCAWYGLGWMVNMAGYSWNSGWLPGNTAHLVRTNEGASWAVAFNGDVAQDIVSVVLEGVSRCFSKDQNQAQSRSGFSPLPDFHLLQESLVILGKNSSFS